MYLIRFFINNFILQIFLALIRLPKYKSDILITFTTPIYIHPDSSSKDCKLVSESETYELIGKALSSFQILSYDIFPE